MARLNAEARAALPDRAFAYIDSSGRRRLPINDAAHVRNALARFGQVAFEDEAARDRARIRLLRAAQKHGIMPIGFINAQLRPRRRLPTGHVTLLMADVENSTVLVGRMQDAYPRLIVDVRRRLRAVVQAAGGHEVDARGDDYFAAFKSAEAAVDAASAIQRAVRDARSDHAVEIQLRIGLHRGRPALTDAGYVGISIHAAARICFAAHGGQIVLSSAVRSALGDSPQAGVRLRGLGSWRFRGLPEPIELFQVEAPDFPTEFPPLRSATPVQHEASPP
jgi:class 3 adenylate cyclase